MLAYLNMRSDQIKLRIGGTWIRDNAIETSNGQSLFGSIYPLSAVELNVLKKYIENNLEKGFIIPFTSPAEP